MRVTLYDANGVAIGTDVTDGLGYFQFVDLEPGTYSIGFPTTLGDGSQLGTLDAGTNDSLDSDANPTTGRTITTTLSAGENDMTWDAAYINPPLSLGNSVWLDKDHDGVADLGEPGIAGAKVELLNANLTPARDIDGNLVAFIMTGTNGEYLFTDLGAGDYVVRVTPPAGLEPTIGGVDPDNDNEKDSNGVEMIGQDYVQSLPITLLNNAEPATDGDLDTNTNLTLDFGFYYPKYDLAMRKTLAPNQPSPVKTGAKVTYAIEVFNQGDLPVNHVTLIDYTPAGLVLDASLSPNWVAQSNGSATGLIINPVNPGQSHTVTITYTVSASAEGQTMHNFAEVTGAKDVDGNPVVDVDSTPDNDPTNDGLVTKGEIYNANGDEDDHDGTDLVVLPAGIWDLALRKSLAPTQPQSVNPGDSVLFNVEVFNQGTEAAYSVKVIDYIPSNMSLNDLRWTAATGNTASVLLNQPLQPGTSVVLPIILKVNSSTVGPVDISNYAEIQSFLDEKGNVRPDADSTPDNIATNDGPATDDAINNENSDQDDSDGATFHVNAPAVFDLALRKNLAEGQSNSVPRGGLVTFVFEVFNQGSIAAQNVVVTDYLPNSLALEDDNWFNTLPGQVATTVYGPIAPGTSVRVSLTARLSTTATANATITNRAEISAAQDTKGVAMTDIDSVMDNNPTNDGTVTNDAINNENGDQDDSDIATFKVAPPGTFDLALRKSLASGQSAAVNAGDYVSYIIEVFNQGSVTAKNIELVDYIPSGMTLADTAWTDNSNGTASMTVASVLPLPAGASVQAAIRFRVNANAAAGSIGNMAEIKAARDPDGNLGTDVDSVADNNPNNDGIVRDDEINNAGFDEDDSDVSTITVNPPARRDLALRKTLAPDQNYEVKPGSLVRYCIEIINQGAVPAKDITICDYMPPNTILAPVTENLGWKAPVAGVLRCPYPGPLLPGQSQKLFVTLKMPGTGPVDLANAAEICDAKNLDGTPFIDVDSTADAIADNDGKPTDNAINNENADEDDHDISTVKVLTPDSADLALRKTIASGQKPCIDEGQTITYNIEVFNQGSLSLKDIKVCDYVPNGLEVVGTEWALETSSRAVCTIAGPLEPGKSHSIQVTFKAKAGSADTVQHNCAEICAAKNLDGTAYVDRDSTPDNDPNNDGRTTNDAINNENFDQDDFDCEDVKINPAPARASIGDRVWLDLNGNGIADPGEQPLQGVVVKLLDAGGIAVDNPAIVGTQPYEATTDINGNYLFEGLPAGNYIVEFVQPAGLNRSSKDLGTDDTKDSDADPITGKTAVITVAAGQARTDVDAAFSPTKTNWQAFLAGDPATNNSATADTDGDGYNSLAEFAFCLKPGSGVLDKCPITITPTADGKLQVCVRRLEGGTGLTISLESLTDLSLSPSGWTALLAGASTTTSNGDGTVNACWNDIESLTGIANGQGFVRARVSLDTNGDNQADISTMSETVGWSRRTFLSQCETYSMPYLKCDGFRGMVSAAAINSISVTNGGVAITSALRTGKEYFVEVLSGPYEGHRFEVDEAATTAGTIAIKLGGTRNTLATVPTDLTGARIALREHWTANELLPASKFRGTTSSTTGDRLMFYNGSGYEILWNVQTGNIDRWTSVADASLADLGTRIIAPCEGLFVHPRNGSVPLAFYGSVRTNKVYCPLPLGNSFLGGGWPMDQSPNSRAMSSTTGFTGSPNAKLADQIRLWIGDTTYPQEGFSNHFLLKTGTINQWTPESPATLANENDVKLMRSTHAVFMQMRNANPGYVEPLPWTP